MTIIASGAKIADKIERGLKLKVKKLKQQGITPKLAVILVGDNPASVLYVKKKEEAAKRIGLNFSLYNFSNNVQQSKLIAELTKIQKTNLSGLIIQLPLPRHLNTKEIVQHIKPAIDVDCLTETNWGKLIQQTNDFEPPTAGAMLEILKQYKIDLNGKRVVIIGRGELVGKPLAVMLLAENCTVTICHSQTKNLAFYTKQADIIFTGAGQPNLISGKMVKKRAVLVDAGTNFSHNKTIGDIALKSVMSKAYLVTPTPGGVGPITVVKLLANTVKAAKLK